MLRVASMVLCGTRKARNLTRTAENLAVLNNSVCVSTLGRLWFHGSEAVEPSVQAGFGFSCCGFDGLGYWQGQCLAWLCVAVVGARLCTD